MYSVSLEIYHHDVHTGWFYNHLTKALPCSFLQNQRTAKKRPDIRNNSHWGIGSDKIRARCTRESSIEGKRSPPQSWAEAREPSRSTLDDAEHMGGQWQIDQKPSSRTFPDLVCLFSSNACSCWCCDNVSFFSSFFREDLPCWFNY